MFFHLLLTTNSDLQCRYCYGKSCEDMDADFGDFEVDYSVPDRITYDIELVKKFCEKDLSAIILRGCKALTIKALKPQSYLNIRIIRRGFEK